MLDTQFTFEDAVEVWKDEAREEGLEQGIEEGMEKGREEAIGNLLKFGMKAEAISAALNVPLDRVIALQPVTPS
ncbi:hypothetical protein AGMMS49579_26910 [Spirochaetia bacterium]|nr:hypothetical protein AGMMS49579_26910 [Spirochaetia bacterium]